MTASVLIVAFPTTDASLAQLLELGYVRINAPGKAVAQKRLGGNANITISKDPERLLVTYSGQIDGWGGARFAVDAIYDDLAAAGLVAKREDAP